MPPLRARCSEQGFTLVELMMAVLLVGIVGSIAVFQVAAVRPGMLADGAARSIASQLNYARERAVSQRREVRVSWNLTTNRLQIIELPLPGDTENVTLSDTGLEGGVQFGLLAGASDTPDGFGRDSAVDFDAASAKFTTDGSLVDDSGNPVNGTFFLVIPSTAGSHRAVTVLGSIGRVRGYRWTGAAWTRM
jgi:prepilin-type N-terminal cleavage/methylation domain-containing protein